MQELKPLSLVVALALICLFPQLGSSQVSYQTVSLESRGQSEEIAIKKGVVEAIGRVNGKTMSAFQEASSSVMSAGRETKASDSFSNVVSQLTYGIVNQYTVVSSRKTSAEMWEVSLEVEVASLSKADGKLSLTILTGNPKYKSESDLIRSSLSDVLVGSRKFKVVEKSPNEDAQSLINDLINNPLASQADRALAHFGQPADMYVDFELKSIDFSFREITLPNFPPMRLPEGSVSISFQIIDTFSSKIKFSDFMILELNASSFSGYSQFQLENQINSVISQIAANRMASKILDAIYPMLIVDIDQSDLASINYGSDLIDVGDRFEIFERGEVVRDPYTKEAIGWSESKVGNLLITRVTPKLSFGQVETGGSAIRNGFADKRYVITKLSRQVPSHTAREVRKAKSRKLEEEF
jgi:hypothetical protein